MPLRIHGEENSQTFTDIHGLWYLSLFSSSMLHDKFQLSTDIKCLLRGLLIPSRSSVWCRLWIFNRLRKYYHRGGFFQDKAVSGEEEPGISVRRGVKLQKASHTISFDKTLEFVEAVGHLVFLRLYLRDYHEPLEEEKCPFRDAWPIAVQAANAMLIQVRQAAFA